MTLLFVTTARVVSVAGTWEWGRDGRRRTGNLVWSLVRLRCLPVRLSLPQQLPAERLSLESRRRRQRSGRLGSGRDHWPVRLQHQVLQLPVVTLTPRAGEAHWQAPVT